MISVPSTGAAVVLCAVFLLGPSSEQPVATGFEVYEIHVDTGTIPLAAWQVEVMGEGSDFRVVGIEGGEHPAFAAPPHHDPAALQGGRVVLAAFDVGDALPSGRTRIATLHVHRGDGGVAPRARLVAAADRDGVSIEARMELVKRN